MKHVSKGRLAMTASVWKPEKIDEFCSLWANPDLTWPQIAVRLGVTIGAARSKAKKLGLGFRPLPSAERDRRGKYDRSKHFVADLEHRAENNERAKQALACRMHLIDIKRAGFKAGHGERIVPSTGRPARILAPYSPVLSPVGSMAAMCIE